MKCKVCKTEMSIIKPTTANLKLAESRGFGSWYPRWEQSYTYICTKSYCQDCSGFKPDKWWEYVKSSR